MKISPCFPPSATLAAFILLGVPSAAQEWELLFEENFSNGLPDSVNDAQWVLEDYSKPFDTIMEDNGIFYQNDYGPAFLDALNSFSTYRKEYQFGKDGWLTASLSARDWNKDGILEKEPSVSVVDVAGKSALRLDASEDHTGGVLLRNSRPLPDEYRIEYKLVTFDFGGKRQSSITYDGKNNGYTPNGPVYPCKTQHPWGEGSGSRGWEGSASAPYCEWQSVQQGVYAYNGFSFLTIVDFDNPAPRNNHFFHYRRKIIIDAFAQHPDRVGDDAGGQVCNVDTNEYYDYRDSNHNVVNMWISGLPGTFNPSPGSLTGSSQRFMTTCNGGQATRGIQSAVELQPELMPNEYYTFAVERNSSGYTMEVSGNFARSGNQTIRLHRPFEVNGEPIWHYNTKPEEYDGRHNADLVQEGWAYGSTTWENQWPVGSAYPDSFVIGDIYTNAYEGVASVTDIKLYQAVNTCRRTDFMSSLDVIESGQRLIKSDVFFDFRKNANLQLWQGSPEKPQRLLWESGVNQPEAAAYFTELQNDGNLVTYSWDPSTSSRTIIWMTEVVGPVEGRTYVLAKDCDENGGDLAVFVGEERLWSAVLNVGPPIPPPTMSPLVEDAVPAIVTCNPTILMKSGDFLYPGKGVVDYERGVYLHQKADGNVQVRWGIPEYPGALLWESGFVGTEDQSYYTKFEANSNIVTWQITSDKSFLHAWELGVYRPTISPYYLVVECNERGNQVAIYQGHPDESVAVVVWAADPPEGSVSVPFARPTIPPTFAPSSTPTGHTAQPTIYAVEIDPNQPVTTTIPGSMSAAFARSLLTTATLMVLGIFA